MVTEITKPHSKDPLSENEIASIRAMARMDALALGHPEYEADAIAQTVIEAGIARFGTAYPLEILQDKRTA